MEIRSRVAGSSGHVLRLIEDEPRVRLDELPAEIASPETFTEIVVTELHETGSRALSGRRLAEYLAAELRGPILASGVEMEVHDAMAKGTAQKRFSVVPRRFTGEPLRLAAELPVAGFPSGHVELYLARGAERPAIQVSCVGTLVADDVGELHALDLDEAPWVGCELSGLIDFPGFTVPPGSRRGVVPDRAAEAFARAMGRLRSSCHASALTLTMRRPCRAMDALAKVSTGRPERRKSIVMVTIFGRKIVSEPSSAEKMAVDSSRAPMVPPWSAGMAGLPMSGSEYAILPSSSPPLDSRLNPMKRR